MQETAERAVGLESDGANGDGHVGRLLAVIPRDRIPTLGEDLYSGSYAIAAAVEHGIRAYRSNGWIYGAVSEVATDVALLPWKIRRGPGPDAPEVTGGALRKLLDFPNPLLGFPRLIELTVTFLELAGAAALAIDPLGGPQAAAGRHELWPLRPDWIVPIRDRDGALVGWEIRANFLNVKLPVNRIAWFQYVDPKNPMLGGLSPLVPAELAVKLLTESANWNVSFFRNNCTPGVIGVAKQGMSEVQRKQFRDDFRSQLQGSKKAFQFLMLNGDVDLKDFQMTHRDMGFGNLMDMARREAFSALKVPPGVAGDLWEAHLARFEVEERIYWRNKIVPLTRRVEEVVNRCIVPLIEPGVFFRYDLSEIKPLQESLTERQEREIRDIEHGLKSPNEILEARGEPTYEGGDQHFISATLVPVGGGGSTPVQPPAPPPPVPARTDAPEMERQEAEVARREREVARASAWRGFDRQLRTAELTLEQIWRRLLLSLSDRIARQIRLHPPPDETKAEDGGSRRLLPQPARSYLPQPEELIAEIARSHGRIYEAIVARFGEAAVAQILKGLKFDAGTPALIALVERDRERVGEEVARLLDDARAVLEEGIGEGESTGDLIRRIRARVAASAETPTRGGPSVRSERIARTEALAAANSGTAEGYRQAGVDRHEWLSSRDAFVRDSHREADGQVVEVGAPFNVGGADLLFPGDPSGPPEEIIQCRCALLPVVER